MVEIPVKFRRPVEVALSGGNDSTNTREIASNIIRRFYGELSTTTNDSITVTGDDRVYRRIVAAHISLVAGADAVSFYAMLCSPTGSAALNNWFYVADGAAALYGLDAQLSAEYNQYFEINDASSGSTKRYYPLPNMWLSDREKMVIRIVGSTTQRSYCRYIYEEVNKEYIS